VDPLRNPFRPGAGRRPPLLAGREAVLDAFDIVRSRAETSGEGDRGWVLTGLRGVGKTALLNELLAHVSSRDWITAKIEAGVATQLPIALSQALVSALRRATGRHPESALRRLLGVFRAFSVSVDPGGVVSLGVDVDPTTGIADTGRFADDLTALFEVLGETARELGIGVLILVDELQESSPDELVAVNVAVHQLSQAPVPLPLMFVGAGLPSLPAQLAEATSYAERLYEYRTVGVLDVTASRDALTVPTRDLAVEWEDDALALAVDAARGYPYFIQSIGKHVWESARAETITRDDVEVGLALARREVDGGLYRSRWDRATPAQRELLRSLARLTLTAATPAIADVARDMGRQRTSDLSVARNELIKKGLLYSPERGLLAFTVPGMDDFINREP
jgi:hypothetical protein